MCVERDESASDCISPELALHFVHLEAPPFGDEVFGVRAPVGRRRVDAVSIPADVGVCGYRNGVTKESVGFSNAVGELRDWGVKAE